MAQSNQELAVDEAPDPNKAKAYVELIYGLDDRPPVVEAFLSHFSTSLQRSLASSRHH